MNNGQPIFKNFVIPKKKKREETEASTSADLVPKAELTRIERGSQEFVKFCHIVKKNFAETGQLKEAIQISSIQVIENAYLAKKHDDFKKTIYPEGSNTKEVHVFLAVRDMDQAKQIADEGLRVKNTFFSDLGTNEEGVYVFRHPDMMIPHPFYQKKIVTGVCFKITAARTNWARVGLGSTELGPTATNIAHQALADSGSRQLNRLEKYRYDQLYVYDLSHGKAEEQPASLVPAFIFEMAPSPQAKAHSDFIRAEIVWNPCHEWKTEGIFGGEQLLLSCIPPCLPKSWGLDKSIAFNDRLGLEDLLRLPVIEALYDRPYWGTLLTHSLNQKITIRDTPFWFMIAKLESKQRSKKYKKIVKELKKQNQVLFAGHETDGMFFIALPSTETTLRLGLPYLSKNEMYFLIISPNNATSLFDIPTYYANCVQEELNQKPQYVPTGTHYNEAREDVFHDWLERQSEESSKHLRGFEPQEQPIVLRPVTGLNEFGVDTSAPPSNSMFQVIEDCKTKSLLKPLKTPEEQAARDRAIKVGLKTTRLRWKDIHEGGELDDAGLYKRRQADRHDYSMLNKQFADKKMSDEDFAASEETEKNNLAASEERAKLFQAAFGNSIGSLDLDAELAPIVFPDDPSEKAKKIIQNKKSVLDMPMPSNRKENSKESPPEAVDVEMDENSQDRTEDRNMTTETTNTSFEDPNDIDYDQMLLGPSGSVEILEEPMEVEEPEKEKTPETQPAPIPVNDMAVNSLLKLFSWDPKAEAPASPPLPAAPASPPASPPLASKEDLERILNSLRANKGESGSQDMDLRQAQPEFVSQPKIIPLVGKVSMSLSKEQLLPKPQLAAFKPEENEEVVTQDKDERMKEKPKDRDDRSRDKDDRDRGRDRDERDRDRDDRRYGDRDRRDRDRRSDRRDRDRDYDRRSERDRRDRDRRDYRDRDMRERKSSQEDTRPASEKKDTDDRILKIPSPVTASQAGVHLIGQVSAPSVSAPQVSTTKPNSPDPASPPASPEPEGTSRASKFVKDIPTDLNLSSEQEDGEIPEPRPSTSNGRVFYPQTRLLPSGFQNLSSTGLQRLPQPVHTSTLPFGIPPPNLAMQPPIINRHFANLTAGSPLTGPYVPEYPNFARPPPNYGVAMPVPQQSDAIFILLDDFNMRLPLYDSQKLAELLNKLVEYNKVYRIPCVLQIHATTEKNLRVQAMDQSKPEPHRRKMQDFLDVLVQYGHFQVVQQQQHHQCDDKPDRQAHVLCSCVGNAALAIRMRYPMARIIYFSNMPANGNFLQKLEQERVHQMNIQTILAFDTY